MGIVGMEMGEERSERYLEARWPWIQTPAYPSSCVNKVT